MHKLNLNANISAWLYKTAKNEIKYCLRKSKNKIIFISDISEISKEIQENQGVLSEIVTYKEYRLLENYYIYDEYISKLANDGNLSVSAMYPRIYRIKILINYEIDFVNIL